jgi:hypothetical protein
VAAVQEIEDKTGDFNRYYHAAGDTVDHMDHDYFLAMTRGLVASVAHLAVPVPGDALPTPAATATHGPTVAPTADATATDVPPTDTRTPSVTDAPPTALPTASAGATDLPPTAVSTGTLTPSLLPSVPPPATGTPAGAPSPIFLPMVGRGQG